MKSKYKHGQVRNRICDCTIESLEARRLFTLDLFFTPVGVLNISETASIDNGTTISLANNGTQISILEGSDSIADTASMESNGWTLTNNGTSVETGPIAGITSVIVDTNDGQDNLKILSTSVPIHVEPREGVSETIQIGDINSQTGCQAITAPIYFDGTMSQSLLLDVDDRTDPNNVDPTITSTQILNLAPAPINFTAPMNGAGSVFVDCSPGTSTSGFVIQQDPNSAVPIHYQVDGYGVGTVALASLNANSSLVVDSQTSNASEELSLGSAGLISRIKGSIDIQGNQGRASLVVNDSKDPTAHTFTAKGNGVLVELDEDGTKLAELDQPSTALTLETGIASNTVNLSLNSGTSAGFVTTVDSNGTNDTINVSSLSNQTQLDLVGGTGVDNVNLTATTIAGTVNISNPTGLEAVSLDGSRIDSAQAVTVNQIAVIGFASGSYNFANLKSLSVTGGTAFDNFFVSPSATIPITIDGGPNTAGPTDRLQIATNVVTGAILTFQSGSTTAGAYTFTNAQPINFSRIGVLDPTFGNITGTTYNAQSATPVSGVTLVVDKNNNGIADAGEPTTTSNAAGTFNFAGLPTGTFNLLATVAGFGLVSPVSVTITAGVLSNPIVLPLIPATVAAGPDLSVTATAVAVSKTGAIKPKVVLKITNVGSAVAASAGLQIKLFASTDQTLDPSDAPLLTTTTTPLILKPQKSKSVTLTGVTAPSLAKGSYYLLASVDTANSVAEANESNNVAATKSVLLAAPVVDLTGKFGALPRKASKSKLLAVSLTIQNLGTIAAAGTVDVDFFASTDKTLDNSDVAVGTNLPVIAHVAAGKTQAAKFKLAINSLPAGSYYLVAKVNSTASILESDLTNNTVFSAVLIAIS